MTKRTKILMVTLALLSCSAIAAEPEQVATRLLDL